MSRLISVQRMRIPARYRKCWKERILSPRLRLRGTPKLSLKFPLAAYPNGRSAAAFTPLQNKTKTSYVLGTGDSWTPDQFIKAGMPSNPLPPEGTVSATIKAEALDDLRAQREQFSVFSPWEDSVFNTIKTIVTEGIPDTGPRVPPANGKHLLTPEELQFAIDKIAQFVAKGYTYGPLAPDQWPEHLGEPHKIGVFLRHQKNSESARIITNCSAPRKTSINDLNPLTVQQQFPYVMA